MNNLLSFKLQMVYKYVQKPSYNSILLVCSLVLSLSNKFIKYN